MLTVSKNEALKSESVTHIGTRRDIRRNQCRRCSLGRAQVSTTREEMEKKLTSASATALRTVLLGSTDGEEAGEEEEEGLHSSAGERAVDWRKRGSVWQASLFKAVERVEQQLEVAGRARGEQVERLKAAGARLLYARRYEPSRPAAGRSACLPFDSLRGPKHPCSRFGEDERGETAPRESSAVPCWQALLPASVPVHLVSRVNGLRVEKPKRGRRQVNEQERESERELRLPELSA